MNILRVKTLTSSMKKRALASRSFSGINKQESGYGRFLEHCEKTTGMPSNFIERAFSYFDEDLSVPFVARYRREHLQNADPDLIFALKKKYDDFMKLSDSRSKKIEKLLTMAIDSAPYIEALHKCVSLEELEVCWEPFKSEKKSSRLTFALSFEGLSSSAQQLLSGEMNRWNIISDYDESRGMNSTQALMTILIHSLSNDVQIREEANQFFFRNISVSVNWRSNIDEKERKSSVYLSYAGFSQKLAYLHSHQLLAIRRMDAEKVMKVDMEVPEKSIVAFAWRLIEKMKVKSGVTSGRLPIYSKEEFDHIYDQELNPFFSKGNDKQSTVVVSRIRLVALALSEAIRKNIVSTAISSNWKNRMIEAEKQALQTFSNNVMSILLTPPLRACLPQFDYPTTLSSKKESENHSSTSILPCMKENNVFVIDPGFSHGNKVAILSSRGQVLHTCRLNFSMNPNTHPGDNIKQGNANKKEFDEVISPQSQHFLDLVDRFHCSVIAIGNGVGSLEAHDFCKKALQSRMITSLHDKKVKNDRKYWITIVNEAGASVYSVTKGAMLEFPGVDIAYLGAISIGRRLLFPWQEWLKIPVESMGIGMYQHDLAGKEMEHRLSEVQEICAAEVGIDWCREVEMLQAQSSFSASSSISSTPTSTTLKSDSLTQIPSSLSLMLSKFSCLTKPRVQALLDHRHQIRSRADLKEVPGIGPLTYRNLAGFLRFPETSQEALDATSIHPEYYELTYKLLNSLGFQKKIGKLQVHHLGSLELKKFLEEISFSTWKEILIDSENGNGNGNGNGNDSNSCLATRICEEVEEEEEEQQQQQPKKKRKKTSHSKSMEKEDQQQPVKLSQSQLLQLLSWLVFPDDFRFQEFPSSRRTIDESTSSTASNPSNLSNPSTSSHVDRPKIFLQLKPDQRVPLQPLHLLRSGVPSPLEAIELDHNNSNNNELSPSDVSQTSLLSSSSSSSKSPLTLGSEIKGIVRNITSFGAFIDLRVLMADVFSTSSSSSSSSNDAKKNGKGANSTVSKYNCNALLPRRRVDSKRFNELRLGQEITVRVIDIQTATQRIEVAL